MSEESAESVLKVGRNDTAVQMAGRPPDGDFRKMAATGFRFRKWQFQWGAFKLPQPRKVPANRGFEKSCDSRDRCTNTRKGEQRKSLIKRRQRGRATHQCQNGRLPEGMTTSESHRLRYRHSFRYRVGMAYPSENPVRFDDTVTTDRNWRVIDADIPFSALLRWCFKLFLCYLVICACIAAVFGTVMLIVSLLAIVAK